MGVFHRPKTTLSADAYAQNEEIVWEDKQAKDLNFLEYIKHMKIDAENLELWILMIYCFKLMFC